jgi:hypothetical protein
LPRNEPVSGDRVTLFTSCNRSKHPAILWCDGVIATVEWQGLLQGLPMTAAAPFVAVLKLRRISVSGIFQDATMLANSTTDY